MAKAGALFGILALWPVDKAQAVSFDCAKAATEIEKLICDNPTVSMLDDDLGKVYQDVVSKANAEDKQRLLTEQEHWLENTRNVCEAEVCFKHAYWMRQAELSAFFAPKSTLYAKESDKAEAIQKVLADAPLYPRTQSDPPLCRQLLADLKEMKGIRFVDPVVQTMSYEDPALDQWRNRFSENGIPFTFQYSCDPRDSGDDIDTNMGQCVATYGLPPYKIYELSPLIPSAKTRYIFYSDQESCPTNRDLKDLGPSPSASFVEIGFEKCVECRKASMYGTRDGSYYNSIIEYQQRYFIMMLEYKIDSYWLDISPIDKNEACDWSPIKH